MDNHYIGITGIKTPVQAVQVLDAFSMAGFTMKTRHVPMIGILVSPRNLDPDWESCRYARIGDIPPIIDACKDQCFLTVHVDAKGTSSWNEDFYKVLDQLPVDDIDGFQINVINPGYSQMDDLRKKYPGKQIILQYSEDFMGVTVKKAVLRLGLFEKCMDRILIDPSRGRGKAIDMDSGMKHYSKIAEMYPSIKIGFAGGFNPGNIEGIVEMLLETIGTEFSLDVESGVRDGDDALDMTRVVEYLATVKSGFFRSS